MNPKKFNAYQKNKEQISASIRTEIAVIREDDRETYADIDEKELEELSTDKELASIIANHAKRLILLRERAQTLAEEHIPDDIKNWNSNWPAELKERVYDLKESELEFVVLQKAKMRKLLQEVFPTIAKTTLKDRLTFDKVFDWYEQLNLSAWDKERMMRIIQDMELFWHSPRMDDVEFVLTVFSETWNVRVKQLLTDLSVLVSIKFATKYGLVGKDFTKTFAEREYGELYKELSQEKKDLFCRGLERIDLQVLKPSELDETKIWAIFKDKNARDELAEEVFRSTSLVHDDALWKRKKQAENDIMLDIAEQKRAEREKALEEGREVEDENYDMYEAFVDRLARMRRRDGRPLLNNVEFLRTKDCVLEIKDNSLGTQYIRIELDAGNPVEAAGNDGAKLWYGIRMIGMPVINGEIRRDQNLWEKSFQQFLTFLENNDDVTALTSDQFQKEIITNNISERWVKWKVFDARKIVEDPLNEQSISDKINLLDPEGVEFGFGPGTAFIAPSTEVGSWKTESDDIWEVVKISGNSIDLRDSWGNESVKWYPLDEFYAFIESTGSFQRINKVKDDTEFLKKLTGYKLDAHAKLKDGKISVTHDDHGKETEKTVECFKSEKWGHIRIEYIRWWRVRFGEFNESGEDIEKIRKYAENKGIDKTVKSYYSWKSMSYSAFLKFINDEKFEATSDLLIREPSLHDLGHHDEHYHAHMEWSLLKRIMKWQNPASIIKGFEMLYHGIEHTLEKWAKLDAARFAMNTSKFLHLPDGVSAQIYSDITSASKEILEKYEQKIFGLPGPRGREKCIHIVHNKDSRPEEVMSAINYMLKSYGHLYAEDIKHYQSRVSKDSIKNAPAGYFAFFDAFVLTGKLWGDLVGWRQKAYDRAITEMGEKNDHEGEPTEEQMIHALLKTIDGNWDKHLYAASVMKANGGPSGFEKIWKFEGYDNAYKKGKDQTQMVNAQWRLNKAISFLGTHEIYKAIGAMEMMAAKVKAPEYQAMPFVWAVWGYSGHASHAALQKLKAYAENGLSFHAFSFLRNKEQNMLYRDTVKLALEDLIKDGRIPADALEEFESICKRLDHWPEDAEETANKYWKVHPPMAMMKFWQKYQGRWLHDMLQGQNGWLISKSEENQTVSKYMSSIRDPQAGHWMQLKDPKIPSEAYAVDWYTEHGYMNMILAKDDGRYNEEYKWMMSLHSMLNKIVFKGTAASGGRPMNDEHYEKIWTYVKRYMTSSGGLRDKKSFNNDTELQKKQYLAHREQILGYLRQELNTMIDRAWESAEGRRRTIEKVIQSYPYYSDLSDMGISPEAVFDKEYADGIANSDYANWTKWLRSGGSIRATHESIDLAELVSGKAHRATMTPSRRARELWALPKDMDTRFGWSAADASEDGRSGD